jgi:phosphomannomutase
MQIQNKETILKALEKFYADANIDHLDGLTVQYRSWWFNLRPSNTEPVMRLNMEADDIETLEQKKEVVGIIRDTDPSIKVE